MPAPGRTGLPRQMRAVSGPPSLRHPGRWPSPAQGLPRAGDGGEEEINTAPLGSDTEGAPSTVPPGRRSRPLAPAPSPHGPVPSAPGSGPARPPVAGAAPAGGLRPAPSRRSLGALVVRAARLPPASSSSLLPSSFPPRPGLQLALTRLPPACPARGACARLSLSGCPARRRRPGGWVSERAGKEARGKGGEGWGGKERGGEEGEKRRGETHSGAPGAGRAAAASRALERLLRRPLREGRAISELGALRC